MRKECSSKTSMPSGTRKHTEKYNLYLGLIYLVASVEQVQQDLEQIKQQLEKRR